MKKFILRGACFAAIGLALLCILNHFYIRTNGYKSIDNTFKFYTMPDDIEVVNLGSSHGEYGIGYDGLKGLTCFNLAIAGQSFHYDLKLLQKYRDKFAPGCTVIIPISYFSFVQQRDFNNQRVVYYRILDYGSVQKHSPLEYLKYRLCPILSASFNAKYLINDREDIYFDIYWLHKALGIDYSEDDVESYKSDAQEAFQYYKNIQGEGGYEEFNLRSLEGILEYCQEEGLKPVLITMPFTAYYNEMFSQRFYDDFYAQIEEVKEKYGVPYLDYSHDPRFTYELGLFLDSHHLKNTGIEVFTRTLLTDLGLI